MSLEERLIKLSREMPDDMLAEKIDFAEYIKYKNDKGQRDIVDKFIKENDIALKELGKWKTMNLRTGRKEYIIDEY